MTTENLGTIIVGGSAAGLAVAACLKRLRQPFIILERAKEQDGVGIKWRSHYDRLCLHTDRGNSSLPHFPMPANYPKYATKDQVVAYLERYAEHFDLAPRFDHEVISVQNDSSDSWCVKTNKGVFRASNIVIATGNSRVPKIPSYPGQKDFQGNIIHSSSYKNGISFRGQRVLVVGFGNSSGEIAVDLAEEGTSEVCISVRNRVNVIPRDFLGLSVVTVGQLMNYLPPWLADILSIPLIWLTIGNLTKYGLRMLPYGPNVQINRDHKVPMIDVGVIRQIKNSNVHIVPGINCFHGKTVEFVDGTSQPFDSVVFGTGYTPSVNDFLNVPLTSNTEGVPVDSGCEIIPGLYFCGFYISPRGMLHEIGIEAKKIAASIAGD